MTVWLWEPVVRLIVESFTVKLLIVGAWLSVLVIVMGKLSLSALPAASVTVAVSEILVVPKL